MTLRLRFAMLLGAAMLAGACSTLRLGYNNADTLLLYTIDSYFDLDTRQKQAARTSVQGLLDWHRRTQLGGYAELLENARQKVFTQGQVSGADVLAFQQQMNSRLAAIGEQAAPELAQLALTLRPEQLERFSAKLAKDTSKARRELVRFAGTESIEQRTKRYAERAEDWFGTLTVAQHDAIRTALAERPSTQQWWMDEREQRQREMAEVLGRIAREKPAAADGARWLREYFAHLAESPDAARRARTEQFRLQNAELIARLINSSTAQQREHLAARLRSYADDFSALAAEGVAAGRG